MKLCLKKIILLFYSFFISAFLFAQSGKNIDSLEKIVKTTTADTVRINTLITLASELRNKEQNKAMNYAQQAISLAKELIKKQKNSPKETKYKKAIGSAYNIIGIIYKNQGNYPDAIKIHFEALKIFETVKDKGGIANCYNSLGIVCRNQGNYPEAIKNHLQALRIQEEIGDKNGVANSYNNIGIIYKNQEHYSEALKNHLQALKIRTEIGDKSGMANSYNNLGITYRYQGNYKESRNSYSQSLKIQEEIGDKNGIASSYSGVGIIYMMEGNYANALRNISRALKIQEEINDKKGIASSYTNMGINYTKLGDFQKAIEHLNKGLSLSKEIGAKDYIKDSYIELSKLYATMQEYKKAYEYYQKYSDIKDTLFNSENSKHIAEMNAQYDSDKKDNEIKLLNKDKDVQNAELKKQRLFSYSIIGGLVLVLLLAFFIYRSYRQKQIANRKLEIKNEKIENAYNIIERNRDEIAQKNKDITDSINYAKRIQQAILPSTELIYKTLEKSFIFYKPKDVVSGDFYAFAQKNDRVILAAVDCTGHGVPGAFMSMIGSDLLNQIIVEKNIIQPAEILNHLHIGVQHALKQDEPGAETRDGMDIALISLQFNAGSNQSKEIIDDGQLSIDNCQLEYAGAMRPLYLIRNGKNELQEIKGDKLPVGGMQTEKERKFTNHAIQLNAGDTIYIFTDGFTDQFGGAKGKKFMAKKFQNFILSIQDMTMTKQRKAINKTLKEWKGNLEQVDDILIIGIKI